MNSSIERLNELGKGNVSEWRGLEAYQREGADWRELSLEISLRILEVLDERGHSQVDFASKLNVTKQQVSKILSGQANLTLETIKKLENALGIELIHVVNEVRDRVEETSVQGPEEILVLEPSEIIKDIPELMKFSEFLEATKHEAPKHQEWSVSRKPEYVS